METKRGYSPSHVDFEKIITSWNFYKEVIGLEGSIIFLMKALNKTDSDIEKALANHRLSRDENIKIYHDIVAES